MSISAKLRLGTALLLLSAGVSIDFCAALANSPRVETCSISDTQKLPLYIWEKAESAQPAALVVAIHGMTLHARRFQKLADELSADNVLVAAADLRGFGARQDLPPEEEGRTPVHYRHSEDELVQVCKSIKSKYPNTPLFVLGESLGANLAIDMAAEHPELLDGVIACSPCVHRVQQVSPHMVADILKGIAHPYRRISLRPYVAAKLSEDPNVVKDYLDDPLIRCDLTFAELLKSLGANKRTLQSIAYLPPHLPILVIAGEKDRIYSSKSLKKFLSASSSRQTELDIKKKRGHLLVEHAFIADDVMSKIRSWLQKQCPTASPIVSSTAPTAD